MTRQIRRRRLGDKDIQVFNGVNGRQVRMRMTDQVLRHHLSGSTRNTLVKLFGNRLTADEYALYAEALGRCVIAGTSRGGTAYMQPLLDVISASPRPHFMRVRMMANVLRLGRDMENVVKNACIDVVED